MRLVNLEVHASLGIRVWVPDFEVATAGARSVLPESVPRTDAVAQAVAAAALPLALERRPDLLLAATEDRLHQGYRAAMMPQSWELLTRLRASGVPRPSRGGSRRARRRLRC
ncbi:hypothetical protein G7085_19335 [Tessaracoccus sp. HDW20]|nr:hypothetical protein [Tessaracoccus coleopterorum]NHB85968.1 hypothetical protein [Tessaracoccus coleopterorum]